MPKCLFVFPEHYLLIMFLLFALPQCKFLILFILAKILEYPEYSLLIKFPVWYKFYQYVALNGNSFSLVM